MEGYYDSSIAYMSQEMMKQTELHRKPYADAIEAMKKLNLFKSEETENCFFDEIQRN